MFYSLKAENYKNVTQKVRFQCERTMAVQKSKLASFELSAKNALKMKNNNEKHLPWLRRTTLETFAIPKQSLRIEITYESPKAERNPPRTESNGSLHRRIDVSLEGKTPSCARSCDDPSIVFKWAETGTCKFCKFFVEYVSINYACFSSYMQISSKFANKFS